MTKASSRPKHDAAEASGPCEHDFAQPFVRDPWGTVGRVGVDVGRGPILGLPDVAADLDMPPIVGVHEKV